MNYVPKTDIFIAMENFESNRTSLRRPKETDINYVTQLESNSLIMKYTPMKRAQTKDESLARIKSQIEKQKSYTPFGIWLAFSKTDGSIVGWFMLLPSGNHSLELGYMIVENKWNLGFATEVGAELIRRAFDHREIKKIVANTDASNKASIRTLDKLGFVRSTTGVETKSKEDSILLNFERFNGI